MAIEYREIEADTLEESRKQISLLLQNGKLLFSESIIDSGEQWGEMTSDVTLDGAFKSAIAKIPPNAQVIKKEILFNPYKKSVLIRSEAWIDLERDLHRNIIIDKAWKQYNSEPGAQWNTKIRRLLKSERIGSIFLGAITQLASVRILYKTQAKIKIALIDEKDLLTDILKHSHADDLLWKM